MIIIQAAFLLTGGAAVICGALFVVAVVQSWREKRALATLPPRMPHGHCVQEAERVLFRYQYRLVHGQVDGQPLGDEL